MRADTSHKVSTTVLAVGLLALAGAPVHAQSSAKGSLAQSGDSMKVVDAVAYFGPAEFGDDIVIKVRLSPHPLDHQAVERSIDFAGELRRQQRDAGGHADFDFSNDGVWLGNS